MKTTCTVLTALALLATVMVIRVSAQTSMPTNRSGGFAPSPPGGPIPPMTNAWPRTNPPMWPKTNVNMWPTTNSPMWPRTNSGTMWPRSNTPMWPRATNPPPPMTQRLRPGGPEPLPLDPPPTMPAPHQQGGVVPLPVQPIQPLLPGQIPPRQLDPANNGQSQPRPPSTPPAQAK